MKMVKFEFKGRVIEAEYAKWMNFCGMDIKSKVGILGEVYIYFDDRIESPKRTILLIMSTDLRKEPRKFGQGDFVLIRQTNH